MNHHPRTQQTALSGREDLNRSKKSSTARLLAVIAASCIGLLSLPAAAQPADGSSAAVRSVYIQSRLDPNAITISEVDIVFIYNEQRLQDFPASKSGWYANRRKLIQEWGDDMDVVSVFIPQGFDSETASLPERRSQAVKVYLFGQHDSAGAKPVDVTTASRVTVYIDPFGIIVDAD